MSFNVSPNSSFSSLAIDARQLGRSFFRPSRSEGIFPALKSFFSKTGSEVWAVNSVDIQIPRGSFVGLVGANGAGKTTFLKMCSGLLHPSRGNIKVLGFTPHDRNREFLKKIGMVMGQKSQLWTDIPAADSFDLLATIYDIPKDRYRLKLNELVELFQVHNYLGVQVRRLSLGERMKLEIIASLLHAPELLFLDEPTLGLDLIAKHSIRQFLRKYNKDHGTTVLLSSHEMEDITETCSRLVVIADGQIKVDSSLDDFEARGEAFTRQIRELISK